MRCGWRRYGWRWVRRRGLGSRRTTRSRSPQGSPSAGRRTYSMSATTASFTAMPVSRVLQGSWRRHRRGPNRSVGARLGPAPIALAPSELPRLALHALAQIPVGDLFLRKSGTRALASLWRPPAQASARRPRVRARYSLHACAPTRPPVLRREIFIAVVTSKRLLPLRARLLERALALQVRTPRHASLAACPCAGDPPTPYPSRYLVVAPRRARAFASLRRCRLRASLFSQKRHDWRATPRFPKNLCRLGRA